MAVKNKPKVSTAWLVGKRTKMICTVGPASDNPETMKELVLNGMTCVRANFSHGTHEEQANKFKVAREISEEIGVPISLMLDTKGPEIRIGKMKDDAQLISSGNRFTIHCNPEEHTQMIGTATDVSVSYRMDHDVEVGDRVLFDDGKLVTKIVELDRNKGLIVVEAQNTHKLKTNKRINLPGVDFSLPFLSEKDINDIEFGIKQKINYIAASFVNNAQNIQQIRAILHKHKADYIKVIAKIESQAGIDAIDDIIEAADGIMIARGDLGLEIPYYDVPYYQRQIIEKCRKAGKISIVATQMLDSMERVPQPTRAEVSDVYWATELGADCTMLSGESASGDFPVKSVDVMANINRRAEREKYLSEQYLRDIEAFYEASPKDERHTIAFNLAKRTASGEYKYAVVCSETGQLLNTIAQYRPNCSVIGVVNKKEMIAQFGISYSIFPCMNSLEIYDEIRNDYTKSFLALNNYECKKGAKYLFVRRTKTVEGIVE